MSERFIIECYIQPQSSKNELVGLYNGKLKIKITAPPVDGKANECLIKFLSKELKISQSNVMITQGLTGRNKRISLPVDCANSPLLKPFLNS
jgi:uncharacterized protein (TIGR00251 family)